MNWDLVTEEPSRAGQFGRFGNLQVEHHRKEPRCRVIAVSGLATKPHSEWTSYSPETRIACNWLSELLPKHTRTALVETFRYNLLPGSIGGFLSGDGITQAAKRLLELIDRSNSESRTAPIVFIAHDLGGIVVKKALLIARESDSLQYIAQKAQRIIFFGTPHRALDEGSWEDLLLGIIIASPAKLRIIPNMSTRLGHLSPFLEDLSRDFLALSDECRIISIFQQVDEDSRDQPVIPPYAATMGVVHETILPRLAKHENLATFRDDQDPIFFHVVEVIKAESNSLYGPIARRISQMAPPSGLFRSHDTDLHRYLELSLWKRPKNGTKPDILAFLDTQLSTASSLYAIGEGHLDARALYQCLRWNGRPVGYFSPSDHDTRLQSPFSLFASLVLQILVQRPQLHPRVSTLIRAVLSEFSSNTRNMAIIFRRLLEEVVAAQTQGDDMDVLLYLLVENIPVADAQWANTIEFLCSLQDTINGEGNEKSAVPAVKIIWLYDRRRLPDVPLDTEPWAPAQLIDPNALFGRKLLEQFTTALVDGYDCEAQRPAYRSLILDHCGYDAELIYCSRALLGRDHELLSAIDKTSPDEAYLWTFLAREAEATYRHLSPWVQVAVAWLVHANRPLARDELQAAVRLHCNNPNVYIMHSLGKDLGDLICASSTYIFFPNKAIRDCFRKIVNEARGSIFEARGQDADLLGNVKLPDNYAITDLLASCIVARAKERAAEKAKEKSKEKTEEKAEGKVEEKAVVAKGPPDLRLILASYAMRFWRNHIRDAPFDTQKIVALSQNEEFIEARKQLEAEGFWSRNQRTKSLSVEGPLALAVQVELPDVVAELVKTTSSNEEIGAAILMAARYSKKDMVSVLITPDALTDMHTMRPYLEAALELASNRNSMSMISKLLDILDKSIDLRTDSGVALLNSLACIAARFNCVAQLKLLVPAYFTQVNIPVGRKQRPLQQAAYYKQMEAIRFLVQDAGAAIYQEETTVDDDTESVDSHSVLADKVDKDSSVLYIAASQGHPAVAEFLLDNTVVECEGMSVNGGKTSGGTSGEKAPAPWSAIEDALVIACKRSHVKTAQLIFHHPAVSCVPTSQRPFNSSLLCSALRAETRPGPKSLAMEILGRSMPPKRLEDFSEPFIAAAEAGQIEFIQYCLATDQPDSDIKALSSAAARGYIDVVQCLLDHGVDVDAIDGTHSSPLALAAVAGHAKTVQILLSYGADIAWVGTLSRGILASAAMSPSCERHVAVIRLLLQAGAPVNALDNTEMTALHCAARKGHINIMTVLLSQPDIDLTITGDSGMTAIHSAAQNASRNSVEATMVLMAAGISPFKPDSDGWLPLHMAAAANNVDLMEFLLKKDASGINARTNGGDTLLHTAYRMCETIIWLIDHDVDVDAETSDGRTTLMTAAKSGMDASAGLLLAFGANSDMLDRHNRSALHYAVDAKNEVIAKMLLDANPAILFQLDSTGTSIVYSAIIRGMRSFALELLDAAEKYAKENQMQDDMVRVLDAVASNTERTAITLAARRSEEDIVERILQLGGTVDKRDYSGSSALVYAIEKGNKRIARAILDSQPGAAKGEMNRYIKFPVSPTHAKHDSNDDDAEIEPTIIKTSSGFWKRGYPAALQVAASVGKVDMIDLLLSYKVNINEQSGQYNTALVAAAAGGYSDAVSLLLENGANTTLPGGSYPNALSAAVASTSSPTINLLLAKDQQAALTRDIQGRNSLHVAVQSRSLDAFEKILAVVTHLNEGKDLLPANDALGPDRQGRRILHFAASSGDADTLRYFLEHPRLQLKDEIDILDNDGWTPLHWACRLADGEDCVQLLLDYHSDPSMATRDGWTPLNIAQYHNAAATAERITSALMDRARKIAKRNNGPEPELGDVKGKPLEPGHLNWNIRCDGCLLTPSVGACYKCKDCFDYDYCFKCHWRAESTHYEGHKWELQKGTVDPGDDRRPPYGRRRPDLQFVVRRNLKRKIDPLRLASYFV